MSVVRIFNVGGVVNIPALSTDSLTANTLETQGLSASLSDGYVKTINNSFNSVNNIPIADISFGSLSNGVLFSNSGSISSGTVDTSNLSSALQTRLTVNDASTNLLQTRLTFNDASTNLLQTRLNITDASVNLLANTPSSGGLSVDDTVFQIESTTTRDYPNFGQNFVNISSAIGGNNTISIACSGNGQYVFAGTNGGSSRASNDYGKTWTNASITLWSVAVSTTGQYVMNSNGYNVSISSNYGSSFTNVTSGSDPAISSTGKYMLAASSSFNFSSNYGSNWTSVSNINTDYSPSALSHDGSIGYVGKNKKVWKTTNYGVNWSNIVDISSTQNIGNISCSGNGKYLLCAPSGYQSEYLYLSSDYGSTFVPVTGTMRPYYKTAISTCGRYMIAVCNSGFIYVSINYGVTWTEQGTSTNYYGVAMSQNAGIIYAQRPGGLFKCDNNVSNTIQTVVPSTLSKGSMYFDEATNKLFVYNTTSSTWKSVTLA